MRIANLAIAAAACVLITACLSSAEITVNDSGERVVLSNGVISVAVAKSTGSVQELLYLKRPQPGSLVERAYWDWDGTEGHGTLQKCVYNPVRNDDSIAEVSFKSTYSGTGMPIDVDVRYVLRSGDSGVYVYAIYEHKADYPPADIEQTRQVWRLSQKVFDWIAVDDSRQRVMPGASDFKGAVELGPKEVEQITQGRFKGEIFHKYDWSVIESESNVHGWASTKEGIGMWVVSASDEYLTGGPTKQNLSSHTVSLMLKMLHSGHYGSDGGLKVAGQWSKVYGPFLVYVNEAGDTKTLWEDAKKKALAEEKAWPYEWMKNPLYPVEAGRGMVKGRLMVKDSQSATSETSLRGDAAASAGGTWVGLAAREEEDTNWQKQAKGYQFWARADKDGNFEIKNVRPGTYTMYAFVRGVMDEYAKHDIKVAAGDKLDIGQQVWVPKRYGKEIWQIGIADRMAAEFRHGGEWYQYGLPMLYPQDFPSEVNYVVGKSDWRKDWNYGHVNYKRDGKWVSPTWKITFDMPEQPKGSAILRFGIASARHAGVKVSVNGREVGWVKDVPDGSALHRDSMYGYYQEVPVRFEAGLLKKGANVVELELVPVGGKSWLKSMMYDCIRLEIESQ